MEVFKILVVLQALVLTQGKLSIHQASTPCSWALNSTEKDQSLPIFTKQFLSSSADGICQALGCGHVHQLNASTVHENASCLSGCIYSNNQLINCTEVHSTDCSILSEVVCDAPYVTPTNHPCIWNIMTLSSKSAVILTRESMLRLSNEICQNFNCGEAFAQNNTIASPNSSCLTDCVFHNSYLWNCSTVVRNDCLNISKVICGNHKVRLSGGSHKCAGRVELWSAGQWGTVCDDEWDKQDADVVCAQLSCGYAISVSGQNGPYSQGKGPILMDELNCTGQERSLWECPAVREGHDCGHKEDAGVVCSEYKALRLTGGKDNCSGRVEIHRNGSWGTVCEDCWEEDESIMACAMLGCGKPEKFTSFDPPFSHTNGTRWFYQCSEVYDTLWKCKEIDATKGSLCNSNAAGLICNSLQVQQRFANLQTSTAAEENSYRNSIHLVKVTNNDSNSGPTMPPPMWTQNSVESTSYDTDYETNDSVPNGDFTLSTFRNSMRYNADDRNHAINGPNLQSVAEEDLDAAAANQGYLQAPVDAFQRLSANPSVYRENMEPSSGEDSPIYSPVSADVEPFSNDSDDGGDTDDYDDVANYSQTPLM
ncbi:deleted in malignant brain tumors 1 protein-like [Silurus meridionalis]|nr:deleted in malignant brain tumors 1 protein-like [Silurus meridionalis]